jgi:hypothetical protein
MFTPYLLGNTGTIIGQIPGIYSPLHSHVQKDDIISINANADIHVWAIYASGFMGILVGEGFR